MASDIDNLIQTAAVARGIDPAYARALFTQESTLNPNAVGPGGSIGIGQVLPSTAANPGYGLKPLSRADMTNPAVAVPWSLDYFKAKALANGVTDLSSPGGLDKAATLYNGGGDPNYVANVRSKLTGQPVATGVPTPPNTGIMPPPGPAGQGPYQATPSVPMPSDFAQPTQGPSPVARVDTSGHDGDGLVSTGLAMMGGNGWHDGMARASDAYAAASAQAQKTALANAGYQNDAIKRDYDAPLQASQVAKNRADAWNALQSPDRITPVQAATLNNQARLGDITLYDAEQRNATAIQEAKLRADVLAVQTKQATPFIIPGDGQKPDQYLTQQRRADGSIEYVLPDGSRTNQMPEGAIPQSAFKDPGPVEVATQKANAKTEVQMAADASAARDQDQRFSAALDQINKPGQNIGGGVLAAAGRALDSATGLNLTGNLTDQQVTNALLQQDMLGQFAKNAKAGGGRGSDALRSFVMQAQPHLGQDPKAIVAVTTVLRDANALPIKVNDLYNGKSVDGLPGLTPGERINLRRTGSVAQWADQMKGQLIDGSIKRAREGTSFGSTPAPGTPGAPGATSPGTRPPLSSFGAGSTSPASGSPGSSSDPQAAGSPDLPPDVLSVPG